jgi:hypothetical protein
LVAFHPWSSQLIWRLMDRGLFHDYIINPAPDMIAGERDMYGSLNVAGFA